MEQAAPTSTQMVVEREEGFLHLVAREGRTFLHWVMGLSLIAVIVLMVSPGFFGLAAIPALFLMISLVLLVLTNEVERRSDAEAHDVLERTETAVVEDIEEDHADDDQIPPVPAAIVKRETRTGALILFGVLVAALLIVILWVTFAGVTITWPIIALGVFVLFCYMLLIAAPLWLGWFNDDIEIESHRLENRPEPASVRTN